MNTPTRPRTIAVVTCYKQPDYIRAVTLRRGLQDSGLFKKVIIIKNRHSGVRRYLDVFSDVLRVLRNNKPDAYVVTFRAYELLPMILLLARGKTIIYDEFINPVEWFVYEHHKFPKDSVRARLLYLAFQTMMKRVNVILADTATHADYSSELMAIDRARYRTIPVGTDETTFAPLRTPDSPLKPFSVLFYGNMLPLHGVEIVLESAVRLAKHKNIAFHFVGGGNEIREKIEAAVIDGASITYTSWVPFANLPALFAASSLCLGGPFGATLQSSFVITGKTYQFLASRKPVVIGINPESSAIFEDKVNALLVEQGDAESLADSIVWAADHPEELETIAQNGLQLYTECFSAPTIALSLRDMFTDDSLFTQPA